MEPQVSSLKLTLVFPRPKSKVHQLRLKPYAGALLLTGGLMMIAMYIMEMSFGVQEGRMPTSADLATSWFVVAQAVTFHLALLLVAAGLGMFGFTIRMYAPIVATICLVLMALAAVSIEYNMFRVLGRNEPISWFVGLALAASLMASLTLGIAVLRTRVVSRSTGIALLMVVILTLLGILLPIPFASVLPTYIAENMHFPIWGIVFVVIGTLLVQQSYVD